MCLQLMCLFLPLSSSLHKLQEDVELEWLRQTEVLYYRLEHSHSNAVQLRHNPWSLKCQQHHLQKMKENAKHHNQYSILSLLEDCPVFFFLFISCQHSVSQCREAGLVVPCQRTWRVSQQTEPPGHMDTCLTTCS